VKTDLISAICFWTEGENTFISSRYNDTILKQ